MSIVPDSEILSFLNVSGDIFTITAGNDALYFKYDAGASTAIDIADGTYEGDDLATALKTAIDTAFTIVSTVTYDSTTRKFTVAVSAGHTIQYINSGSDAGLTFGFTENSSTSLSITSDSAATGSDTTSMALTIRDESEAWIKRFCRRDFESTAYTKEFYSGNGGKYLSLKQRPITALTLLSFGTRDAIRVTNNADYTTASVSVTSTGITLEKDGVTSTLAFTDYTTMSTMVTAINAVGSDWEAHVVSSEYDNFASSHLLTRWGASAIESNWVYLYMPEEGEDEFQVFDTRGQIYHPYGFPCGNNNIIVSYTAGYSAVTMPDDLKLGIKIFVKNFYDKWQKEQWNLNSYKIGDVSESFSSRDVPSEALRYISPYRRRLV